MDRLPGDAITNIAGYLVAQPPRTRRTRRDLSLFRDYPLMLQAELKLVQFRGDLLHLRAASVAWRDAVRDSQKAIRAEGSGFDASFETGHADRALSPEDPAEDPRSIAAIGAVYGVSFGTLSFGRVLGYVNLVIMVGSFGSIFSGWVFDMTQSYDVAFWIFTALILPGIMIMFFLPASVDNTPLSNSPAVRN